VKPSNFDLTQQRHFVAVHEAAHAFVAWIYGMSLISVSVRPQPYKTSQIDGIVESRFCETGRADAITFAMFSVPRVFEILAGRGGTDFFLPSMPTGSSYQHDFQNLAALKSLDSLTLKMHAWKSAHPDATTEEFYQNFKSHLYKIFKTKRAACAILSLATALQEQGTLSGQEAAKIFMAVYGKQLPKWSLPLERHQGFQERVGRMSFADLMRKVKIYAKILRDEILPNQDQDHNSVAENAVIQKIADQILYIRFLAAEDETKNK